MPHIVITGTNTELSIQRISVQASVTFNESKTNEDYRNMKLDVISCNLADFLTLYFGKDIFEVDILTDKQYNSIVNSET